MTHILSLLATVLAVLFAQIPPTCADEVQTENDALTQAFETVSQGLSLQLTELRTRLKNLARQAMLIQFATEERVRTDGQSGVKAVRANYKGPANYYETSFIGNGFMSVHDHSNYYRTIGLGEFVAVMNGIEFRTRHNDYKLVMPSTNSTEYHATENIPFPKVPHDVTEQDTVDKQIAEMREWFKAFAEQNYTVRDYRDYFKPVLCYLEGTWTLDKELDEPFKSDRHMIDVSSWFDLQENIQYTSYTGTKSRMENLAYLPTTIMSVDDVTGLPNFAQWNYRIVCSPVQKDVPTRYFKPEVDLAYTAPRNRKMENMIFDRGQRFRFYELDTPEFVQRHMIDDIFAEIPGKDNIPEHLNQSAFGEDMFQMDGITPLNTGYYHRSFKFSKPGAMGTTTVSRGFNDANLWVAQTTQKRVAPIGFKMCKKGLRVVNGRKKWNHWCWIENVRFSYAIPLEMIYLTPLLTWNPYNLAIHQKVDDAGRMGRSMKKPLDALDSSHYYMTPSDFFKGRLDTTDKADTVKSQMFVADENGVSHSTAASGTRIVLQEIEGIGRIRLRYPFAPVFGEGSAVWKELNALKHSLKKSDSMAPRTSMQFQMSPSVKEPPGEHNHMFILSIDTYIKMIESNTHTHVTTTENEGHSHILSIHYNTARRRFEYVKCDGLAKCSDGHATIVTAIDS